MQQLVHEKVFLHLAKLSKSILFKLLTPRQNVPCRYQRSPTDVGSPRMNRDLVRIFFYGRVVSSHNSHASQNSRFFCESWGRTCL